MVTESIQRRSVTRGLVAPLLAVVLAAGCGDGVGGRLGGPRPAPLITTQPADQTVTEGQTATFTVTATGSGTLAYQWKKDGTDIAGATGASYTTPATTLAASGAVFTCVVTNTIGSVESNPATLTVNIAPPTITTHPADQTVTEGQTATFSVTATGSGTLTYQWKKDGTDITGATSSSYMTPATVLADDGAQFTCVVANAAGSVTSNVATLTVSMAPPTITTHPVDATVTEGQTATFMVAATSSGSMTYQWRKDTVDIGGATSDSYTTPATTPMDNGAQFSCVVLNAGGNTESNVATLAVMAPPEITVIKPNGTELLYHDGRDTQITWTSTSGNVDIHYSTDGSSWTQVALDTPNTGLYLWVVPDEASSLCYVRVREAGGSGVSDTSDGSFTIAQLPGTMIGHWKFDETSGIQANDSSGNLNDGTLIGVTFDANAVSGKIGGALSFTKDVRDYVEALNTDNLNSPVTFSFWVEFSTVGIAEGVLAGFAGPRAWSIMLLQWSGSDNLWWVENAIPGGTSTTTAFQVDTWYHLAVVHNLGSGTLAIYVNGTLERTGSANFDLQTGVPLQIGDGPASSAFHGIIDDVRVYGRVLTNTEIQALYDAGWQ